MRITLLCNTGLAITHAGQTLLIDVPNEASVPFYALPDDTWNEILNRESPYDQVCGLLFSHTHPDHCDRNKVRAFRDRWSQIRCFLPEENPEKGTIVCGPFIVSYMRIDHAPMEGFVPPHVVFWVRAGEKSVYISSDAKPDVAAHQAFLKGRQANAAFWISIYMSQPDTRALMAYTAPRNYIYHMPKERPDDYGLWKKCDRNFQRYAEELRSVVLMEGYPYEIEI